MLLESLTPPLFLVAMPQVVDPFFNRSVILLLEHSDEGSFGLIVNRPLEMTIASVASELGVEWHGDEAAHVHFGGPVQMNAGITLFQSTIRPENAREIISGVQMATDVTTLRELAQTPPPRFLLVVGYAGWTAGQLEDEITRNDWLLAPFDAELLFAADPASVWPRALDSIGVRPESLPSWTRPPGDDEVGN
jgi:putative transcriptional regulator